jgi:hypothetical protein
MYALLAGRPPFLARNLPQMLQLQRFAKPEPVRRYAPDTPEQLERVIMQLLAKNPADRFPNTQVLARHLQAMVKALSRPTSDDFALASEQHLSDPDDELNRLLGFEATQLETELGRQHSLLAPEAVPGGTPLLASSQDAVTMAAEDLIPDRPSTGQAAVASAPAPHAAVRDSVGRPAHFTTVEEDEARRRAEHQRSWIVVAGQLAALAAVIVGMAATALYLSRPPSADELYQTIKSRRVAADDASLANAEREIDEFLQHHPTDPRADELARYHEQIILDKAERKLQREGRGGTLDSALLPAEQLYLRALNMANASPNAALSMLQSLVDLYSERSPAQASDRPEKGVASAGDDRTVRIRVTVQLAKRRLAELQKGLAKQRETQLAEIRERLETAARLMESNPHQAALMYRAIIDLYEPQPWAAEAVAEARRHLEKMKMTNE